MINTITTRKHILSDSVSKLILNSLETEEINLNLKDSYLYYDFPVYKDLDDKVLISKILLISHHHGIILIETLSSTTQDDFKRDVVQADVKLDQVYSAVLARLIRNRNLRKNRKDFLFPFDALIFAPLLDIPPEDIDIATPIIYSQQKLISYIKGKEISKIDELVFKELIATIEGSKGIIKLKNRDKISIPSDSKGSIIKKLESEIASFDQQQRYGTAIPLDGLQRIRGLAGSGKTIVLAMKAAVTHLRDPDAIIVYTFYTKSLYQLIKRLITRFYRQFDDRDPDWTKVRVLHAWGGKYTPGVYYDICQNYGIEPMTYSKAAGFSRSGDPFDFVCKKLLNINKSKEIYDYLFIDEGQDFPLSFIKLGVKITNKARVVWAYDELQTIFRPRTPTAGEIFGTDDKGKPKLSFSDDIVLYKCYRNPREMLVIAHALGFGIYGPKIVQMLENEEYWKDIGYVVKEGKFKEGSNVVIERPEENSLTTISDAYKKDEIVKLQILESFDKEINFVVSDIEKNIKSEGLLPDDILVIAVDDRHAKGYLNKVEKNLAEKDIKCNNIHADFYGLRDFHKEGCVTLSTVHKAKGNEAFLVYVMGIDSLFSTYAGVRERNILFTAITRAKAWVVLTGLGESAQFCKKEIKIALEKCPYLTFKYPSSEELKIMQRDLQEKDIKKHVTERMLDRALEEMTQEEIIRFIKQRAIKKG